MCTLIYTCLYPLVYSSEHSTHDHKPETYEKLSLSRLTVVSHEAKEEVPCDGLSTNACEYFTRTNLVKIKNAVTDGLNTLSASLLQLTNVLSW